MWHELRGTAVLPISTELWRPVGSVSKSKTFSQPSNDRDFVYAKLIRNLESAFIKLRRHQMRAGEIAVSLRYKDYRQVGLGASLSRSVTTAQDVTPIVRQLFGQLHVSGSEYRATGVVLGKLQDDRKRQFDLFEDAGAVEHSRKLGDLIEQVNARYGKHRIFLGTGLNLPKEEESDRDQPCWRKVTLLPGETARKRIRIPVLDMVI
jgi:hypothetical protein